VSLRHAALGTLWLIVLACALWIPVSSGSEQGAGGSKTGSVVARADAIRTTDHPRFVVLLEALHRDAANLAPAEKRYLRLLDGWEANYAGRYPEAEKILRDIVADADDDAVGTRAAAMLMFTLGEQGKYAEAYAIATRAADTLPEVTDPLARSIVLANLSQMLTFAGEPELGIKYADMMIAETPPGRSRCQAMVQKVTALEGARRLNSRSNELKETIDSCNADRQPVFANTVSMIFIDRLLAEGRSAEALEVVEQVAPSIKASGYFSHLIDLAGQRARIYAQQGRAGDAQKAALNAVAMSHSGDIIEALRSSYRILYMQAKQQGHFAEALDYYEHYVVQDQGYLRDANVRNAAYEAARQHFLSDKLKTEGLSKENRILRLQRALDASAVETSRLYIVVLGLVLLSIVFWLVRTKRSQLRFKWLSSRDGLTGIYHHQHFMSESDATLRDLQRRQGECCLVFLDLDHFKQVNDSHGHAVGDAVLKHAVAICKGHLRQADLLGRLGGEEFGVLLVDTPQLQGVVVAERIRRALHETPLPIEGVEVSFSASLGLACTELHRYDLQRLCRAADSALYQAKALGRNRVVVNSGDEKALDLDFPPIEGIRAHRT
jgi:diguanylate cyclase (GGDEF) domain